VGCSFPYHRILPDPFPASAFDATAPIHRCNEKVPFRLTPNMQHFITPTGIEGLLTSSVIAMARSLSMPEFDLESCLSLFLRDEVSFTVTDQRKPTLITPVFCRYHCGSPCIIVKAITHCLCTPTLKAGFDELQNLALQAKIWIRYACVDLDYTCSCR
jgi:hypothetical protein